MAWPVTQSPLIGRDHELAVVVAALRVPGAPGVLIAGPTGVGKTRLAREAAEQVRDARVLPVHCPAPGSGLALAGLASLLPAVDGPGAGPDSVRLGLLGLRRLAEQAPTVLSVDDAHRLDDTSLAVLYQAVAAGIVTLLATARSDEPARDALIALWKDAGVIRIDLAGLDVQASDALLTATLGGPVEGQALRRLRDTAAGNPLFLRELVTSALEAGLLVCAAGLWRLTGPLTAAPRLVELLRSRLAATDAGEREALELLAAGEPVPLPVATALAGEEVWESLERRGLVVADLTDHQTIRLSHPLYGELLRADTPAMGRRRHVRRLADALEADGRPSSASLLRIALWRLDGGGPVNPASTLDAADQATLTRDHALAQRLAHRAYQAGGGVPAGLASVRALVQLGRAGEAVALCRELSTVAAAGGIDADRCQVAIQHAEILVHAFDDVHGARAVLDGVAAPSTADGHHPRSAGGPAVPGVRGPWRDGLGSFHLYLRSYQLDCTVIDEALAAFRGTGPVAARLAASSAAGCALLLTGRIADAEALATEAVRLARRHTGSSQMQSGGIPPFLALLRCYRPDPQAALALALDGYEASLHPPNPVGQALHALALAQVALLGGRPRTALRWAQESRLVAEETGLRPVFRWACAVWAQAGVQLGDDVTDVAADLHRHAGGPQSVRLFDIEIARATAWLGAARGDGDAGHTALAEAVAVHGRQGAVGAAALGALDLVRLGGAGQAARLLARHPPHPDWPLGRTIVRYATATVAAAPHELLDVAVDFAAHGMPLHAAEAANLAGTSWLAAGDLSGVARAQLLTDTQLARIAEPVRTPALRRRAAVSQLTAREREIVLAAAGGERSRDIAERLHLSERTVENHLHRAYGKLGVAGRAQLRDALGLGPATSP